VIKVIVTQKFLKQLERLEEDIFEEALIKIEDFKNADKHAQLKVHKLHGRFSGYYSFSVNHRVRIVFLFISKNEARLHLIGGHEIYK
jgi:mRNA-degrading endonuclease YafQ of YafQ-DinJ toxin-antitoxin module